MTEKEKYFKLIQTQIKNGMVAVGFYPANVHGKTEEEAYAELNRMHEAKDMEDVEVLGRYSPLYDENI